MSIQIQTEEGVAVLSTPQPSYQGRHQFSPELQKQFAKGLAEALQRHGMSNAELARKLEIGKSNVSAYLSGLQSPSRAVLNKMAAAFDCTVDELLGVEEGEAAPVVSLSLDADDPQTAILQVNARVPLALATEIVAMLAKRFPESLGGA